jgi:hypothetical protein
LSKMVDSLSDSASCGLAKTRFPPSTGVPAAAELLLELELVLVLPLDDEPPDPQAASRATVQQDVRAIAKADLGLIRTPGVPRATGVSEGMQTGGTQLCRTVRPCDQEIAQTFA